MPAAETAGLAIGVIALASLFTTCLELLDYFELGRNYLYDYRLACTKTNILHERLSIWGCTTNILHEDLQHPALRAPAVRDSLEVLRDILFHTEGLRKKYDLSLPIAKVTTESSAERARSRRLAVWTLQLRRRTTWSIRDKPKFDHLINEIGFLLENLEKVTDTASSFSAQSPSLTYRDLLKMHPTKDTDTHGKYGEGAMRGSGTQRRQPALKDADIDEQLGPGGAVQGPRRAAGLEDNRSDQTKTSEPSNGASAAARPLKTVKAHLTEGFSSEVIKADVRTQDHCLTILGPVGALSCHSSVREPKSVTANNSITIVGPTNHDSLQLLLAAYRESAVRGGKES